MLTLTQAAALLGVTAATLRQQIANKKLRARKVGRDWTVSEKEVERYRKDSLRAGVGGVIRASHTGPNGERIIDSFDLHEVSVRRENRHE